MFIPDSLKLNKHQLVKIPSNKDYFSRLGQMQLGDDAYTGDKAAAIPAGKINDIIAGEFEVERQLREKADADAAAAAAAAKPAEKKDELKNDEK